MNTTFPGYQIVFVEPTPKKPKAKDSFSWVLHLPAAEFSSKDSLEPHKPDTPFQPLFELCSPCEEPQTCLSEAAVFSNTAGEEVEEESQLPEAELVQEECEEVKFICAKPKARALRVAPEFVSQAHEYSGPLLGEIRCFHGMTLGELANVTRVAQHHLQNIEREQYDRLPAMVYLRGYLKSVARELGLDVQLVSQSYLDRMQQAKS